MWITDFIKRLEITEGAYADFTEIEDVYNCCMVVVCVVCAGMAAGLTIGLLSLDITKLEIKLMVGTDAEKDAVNSLLPIVKQHHLLLVTLLLFNSIANETLPIFLGALVPNYIAVILSVTLVLIFGEIIPSALFTGPDQLLTAAKLTRLVYFLLGFFYPISWPISKILDYLFGEEEENGSFSREELEALVLLQGDSTLRHNGSFSGSFSSYGSASASPNLRRGKNGEGGSIAEEIPLLGNGSKSKNYSSTGNSRSNATNKMLKTIANKAQDEENQHRHHPPNHSASLTVSEVSLMTGILRLSKFTVKDTMIPMKRVSMISSSIRLDEKSLYDILDSGYSRIPVYKRHDKQHILGYLLVKELIVINPNDNVMVENVKLREPLCVKPTIDLMDLLALFQEAHSHLAVVSANPMGTLDCMRERRRPSDKETILGIVTMEDVLEKIIQSDILDETDASTNITNPMMLYYNPKSPFHRAGGRTPSHRPYPTKDHRQPRIFATGSVVTSDYYAANRNEHFGLPPEKEDSVHIINEKNYYDTILGNNSDNNNNNGNSSSNYQEEEEKEENNSPKYGLGLSPLRINTKYEYDGIEIGETKSFQN